MKFKKKGFTIVELVVIMAVIGILVLLAVPKFKNYTDEASITRMKSNIKELENASERYYMHEQDWPRISDEPYTSEQLSDFAEEIKSNTGQTINLDTSGKYYELDYIKLSKYVQKPKDGIRYVIQNPVGDVFYLDKLTPEGVAHFKTIEESNGNQSPETNPTPSPSIPTEPPISTPTPTPEVNVGIFHGLDALAFDKNINTWTSVDNNSVVTWNEDLANKSIHVYLRKVGVNNSYLRAYFKDINGNNLSFYDTSGNLLTYMEAYNTGVIDSQNAYFNVIIPEGAIKITFVTNELSNSYVRDIYVGEDLVRPEPVENITSVSKEMSITLNWEQMNSDYQKTFIFRNDVYIGYTAGLTFTDTPLFPSTEYKYTLQIIDTSGNASNKVDYITKTLETPIAFSGLAATAFDKNVDTMVSVTNSSVVTWTGDLENKKLNIYLRKSGANNTYLRAYFKDANGNTLSFKNVAGTTLTYVESYNTGLTNSYNTYFQVIVPKNAVKITFTNNNNNSSAYVRDIHIAN